jgi:putative transposase
MARRNIVFRRGEYYHIYNRGCNRQRIFLENENYSYLLRLLHQKLRKFQIKMIAFCLMPNHYHFLVRQESNCPVNQAIQSVFNSYTKAVNKRYGRTGTLFEGPFRAKCVHKQNYLLRICRYIHCNPVKAKLASAPELWRYSNYSDWIRTEKSDLADGVFISKYFGSREKYKESVDEYLQHPSDEDVQRYLFGYNSDSPQR